MSPRTRPLGKLIAVRTANRLAVRRRITYHCGCRTVMSRASMSPPADTAPPFSPLSTLMSLAGYCLRRRHQLLSVGESRSKPRHYAGERDAEAQDDHEPQEVVGLRLRQPRKHLASHDVSLDEQKDAERNPAYPGSRTDNLEKVMSPRPLASIRCNDTGGNRPYTTGRRDRLGTRVFIRLGRDSPLEVLRWAERPTCSSGEEPAGIGATARSSSAHQYLSGPGPSALPRQGVGGRHRLYFEVAEYLPRLRAIVHGQDEPSSRGG